MYERQRVWRACQACRRKKVKCDGEHPCESCTRNQAECVYVDPSVNMKLVDPQYLMKLENQIKLMEKRLYQQSEAQPSTGHDGQSSLDEDVQTGQKDQDTRGAMNPPVPRIMAANVSNSDNANHDPYSLLDQQGDSLNEGSETQQVEPMTVPPRHPESAAIDVTRLPEPLLQLLIELFYRSIYPIFPIISQCDFQPQYDRWLSARQGSRASEDDEFLLVLYALLAVASFLLPAESPIFDQPCLKAYKQVDLGGLLYSHATPKFPGRPPGQNATLATNLVVAQGLLTFYLTECGKVNDAWITAGHAIRLYQALDFDNGVDAATEVHTTDSTHDNLWWCLYILDRSLSTVLLKPLAIDNAESNMDLYGGEGRLTWRSEDKVDPWFPVIAEFHIILGRIYKSVRWIRRRHQSHNDEHGDGMLRSEMKRYDIELERYYTKRVLPRMQGSHGTARPLALQNIAESSYYIGLVLLYRTFIEKLNIEEPEVFLRCAKAASSCIRVTPQVMATVPACHFVIQQCRAVYTSAKVLLHCMRLVKNKDFTNNAWPDVQRGCDILRKIKVQWPEVKSYQKLTEEDMYRTQIHLSKHELFHRVFDRYGEETCSGPIGDSRTNDGSLRRTSSSHGNNLHQYLPGTANNDTMCQRGDLVNNAPEADLTRTPQSLLSHNYGQDSRLSERQPKRRRLSQNFYAPPAPSPYCTLNQPSMISEVDRLPMLNATIGSSDFLLPGIPPLPPTLGDSPPTDLLEDTMLMSSFDLFLSHSE